MAFRLLHADLIRITQARTLEVAGSSLVSVFLPLLLLNEGLQLYQVCLFYVGYSAVKLVSDYSVTKQINRRGPRFGLLSGYVLSFLFTLVLSVYIATNALVALAALPVIMGLRNTFLWSSEHLYVSKAMDTSRKSRDLATMSNLVDVALVFSPLIGGLIGATFGALWLTLLSAAVILLALVSAMKISQGHNTYDKTLRWSLKGAPRGDIVANFGFNTHTAVGVFLWPIYLAVFVPNFQSIGIITAVSAATSILIVQAISRRGDRGKTSQILTEGTALSSFVHLTRLFAGSNPVVITAIGSAYDLALGYQFNPWVSLYYTHTRRYGINYIMSMEIAGDLAYLFLWSVLATVSYASQSNAFFYIAFIFAALVAWPCLFITKGPPVAHSS